MEQPESLEQLVSSALRRGQLTPALAEFWRRSGDAAALSEYLLLVPGASDSEAETGALLARRREAAR